MGNEENGTVGRRDFNKVFFVVIGVLFLTAGVGTVGAQSAPDCSTVSYSGDGTEANPYEIGNVDQLQCIESQGLDASYEVVSDIDASGTASWNSGNGFNPIGGPEMAFTGMFDGEGHTIENLEIDRGSENFIGLFASVRGTVMDVSVVDADITGSEQVGILAGFTSEGTISEAYVTGSIDVNRTGQRVGGLVGLNNGMVSESHAAASVEGNERVGGVGGLVGHNEGTISEASSIGSVSSSSTYVGGLVGVNDGTVEESYATGSVEGSGAVGGLAGRNADTTIKKSYATGSVEGNERVGGLVGWNFDDGTVEESYATGSVEGNERVGGLVGFNEGAVGESYWDRRTSRQSASDGGIGLTTAEMKGNDASSNMNGFDFTSTWVTMTTPDYYPILAWQTEDKTTLPNFQVTIENTNSPVTGGRTLRVRAAIINLGGQGGSQTVTVEVPGIGSDSKTVELNGISSTTETFTIPTSSGDDGSYSVSVSTDDDSTSTSVSVSADQPSGGDSDGSDGTGTDGGGTTGDDGSGSTQEGGGDDTAGGDGDDGTTGGDGDGSATDGTEEPTEEGDTNWLIYALGAIGLVGGGYGGYRMLNSSDKEEDGDGDSEGTGRTPPPRGSRDSRGAGGPPSAESADEYPSSGSLTYDDIEEKEPIGSGGNADVYRAVAKTDDGEVTVAVKEPRMSGTLHIEKAERIMQEAETWDKLDDHENIVSVVDYGSEPLPWIAMEYMDAGDMTENAEEMKLDEGLWAAICVTQAVRHAHRHGVAHLDLKPENILFRETDNDHYDVPKVGDWGLAKMLLEHSKSVEGMSPQYSAPEQFDEDEYGKPDDMTDIYQLGAVFYELFTGRPPFEGQPSKVMHSVLHEEVEPPTEVNPDLPSELDDVLLKALEKNKEDRYETVIYLRDDLRELL